MSQLSLSRPAILSLLILLAGAGWVWQSRALPGATTAGAIPAPRQGFSAPDFSLQTLSGETVTLSALRGQPLLVNVWASWCLPCKAEMPALQRVYEQYQPQGFTVLAVNATSQDDPGRAAAFAEQLALTFPVLMDPDGQVSRLYETRALPTSFFIDRQGVIREVIIGGPMSEALLRIRVAQLLEDRSTPSFEISNSRLAPAGTLRTAGLEERSR